MQNTTVHVPAEHMQASIQAAWQNSAFCRPDGDKLALIGDSRPINQTLQAINAILRGGNPPESPTVSQGGSESTPAENLTSET